MTEHRRPSMALADYVRELTEPHHHTEHYAVLDGANIRPGRHVTRTPSLLAQLQSASPSSTGEDRAQAGYASRPAARLEALDCLTRIDLEAARWVRDLGEDDPLDTALCVRRLHSLMPSADEVTRREVERDVRRWWTQARVTSGWDSPAWRPDNTCPLCGVRGTLRVKLGDQAALCVDCGESWSPGSIGLLADHIRAESEAERQVRPGAGPCWCPVPEPDVPDLRFQCPACGSARCWHAIHARLIAGIREAKIGA